jgi:3-dehydroquinate dehydratase
MAESTIPNTGDPRVDAALDRIRGKFSDLEDAMLVQAHLEKGMAERLKEHADLIASHHDFIKTQEEAMRKHTQQMSEFDEKLNALIDIVGKMQGGMESRPS